MPVKKGLSPTQRTLRELRNQGCICDIVERFNSFAGPFGKRMDYLGFIDLIALAPDGIVGVQCCAGSGMSDHRKKILENEYAPEWLKSGGRIELWGWRKLLLKRGGKAMRWSPKVEKFTKEDFE